MTALPHAPLASRLRLWWRGLRRGPVPVHKALGYLGEDAAATFLKRRGFRVLGRNIECGCGEADLVCRAPDRRTMVLVEVKTKRTREGLVSAYPPELSVHAAKRRKLTELARHLAKLNRWRGLPLRIDVVAVEWPQRGKPVIRHWEDAVK